MSLMWILLEPAEPSEASVTAPTINPHSKPLRSFSSCHLDPKLRSIWPVQPVYTRHRAGLDVNCLTCVQCTCVEVSEFISFPTHLLRI